MPIWDIDVPSDEHWRRQKIMERWFPLLCWLDVMRIHTRNWSWLSQIVKKADLFVRSKLQDPERLHYMLDGSKINDKAWLNLKLRKTQ
jgi:hypothetical protein